MFSFTPSGYSNNNTAESLTEDEDEDRGDPSVWRPLPGGPFSALISSMWPQKSDKKLLNDHERHGKNVRIDEFGYKIEENDENEPSEGVVNEPFIEDAQQRLRWIAFLEFTFNNQVEELSWDKLGTRLPRSEKLRAMIQQGIPHSLRSHIWMRISGAMEKKIKSELPYKEMVKASTEETSMSAKQIEKDLLRTIPTNLCFSSSTSVGVPRLRRILRAIAWLYPDIGYCQGTGMIVASLLLVMEEEDAFWMTCAIFEDLLPGSYYSSSLIGAQADQRVLRQLIATHLPEIDLVLKRHDIEIALICLHWFLTLFSSVVNVRLLWRIWDIFFYGGSVVLFQLALGMIKAKETDLVSEENTAYIFNILSDIPAQLKDIDVIIELGLTKVGATLTETLIETHRRRHLAYLMADQGLLSNPDPNRNLPKERITRRQLKRTQSLFLSLFSSAASDETSEEFLRDKNVRQTELLVDLKEAILQIIRHFQAMDPQYADVSIVTDYSMESHARDHERFAAFAQTKRKRAKALLDFERHDEDELGFRKNDIITILSQRDEHCWIGDLEGVRGWFPAKFVELVDERSKEYSAAGDDSVTEAVADLVRGILCPTLKAIFEHGLRRTSLLGGACHPWLFIEEAASKEVEKDFDSVVSRLLLCRTFRLDEDGKVLTPEEILFRCVQLVNSTHDPAHAQMDVKFRSLVVLGLNEQVLHLWLECLCSCVNVVEKWYYPWSFLRSPGWVQIKCELRILAQLAFRLSHDWELPRKVERNNPLRDGVRDMLIKHHLFSWEI